jgi:YbbR domain-containing protein
LDIDKLFVKAVRNWPAKVLSLALAIILFVFHRMITLETRFFSVPVVLENLNGMVMSSSYPRMIRVSLRGEANSIYSVMEDDIEVYVDMDRANTPGTYVVPVQWRRKDSAQFTDPVQISVDPMEITLSLDNRMSKFVPIIANFKGQVENGYTMTAYTLNPNQIIIDGPEGLTNSVTEVYTEEIDLSGRTSDFSITAAILQRDPLIVIRGNGVTEFHGTVTQLIPVRNIPNVPIAITALRENLTGELNIKTASIRLEGSNRNTVEAFVPSPDFLSVDCSEIEEPGIYTLSVFAKIAENLRVRVDPVQVRIEVNYVDAETEAEADTEGET